MKKRNEATQYEKESVLRAVQEVMEPVELQGQVHGQTMRGMPLNKF